MPIMRCTLNGLKIQSLEDFYDQISRRFSLPDHFDRNLDALWDALSTDVAGPFEIFWTHTGESKKFMGKDYTKIVKLLDKLAKEREDFRLVMKL